MLLVTPAGQIPGDWVPPMAGVVGGLVGLVVTVVLLFLVEQLWRLAVIAGGDPSVKVTPTLAVAYG